MVGRKSPSTRPGAWSSGNANASGISRDVVESKRIYDPFFILGQRGYEHFQTGIFLDIC